MPTLILTDPFKIQFQLLTDLEQKQSAKALRLITDNPKHPSLNVHRVKGTVLWEAYVNKDIRIIYEQNSDTLLLKAIGHHDILKKY